MRTRVCPGLGLANPTVLWLWRVVSQSWPRTGLFCKCSKLFFFWKDCFPLHSSLLILSTTLLNARFFHPQIPLTPSSPTPGPIADGCLAVFSHSLFVFGGFSGSSALHNTRFLWELNISALNATHDLTSLAPNTPLPALSWTVHYPEGTLTASSPPLCLYSVGLVTRFPKRPLGHC